MTGLKGHETAKRAFGVNQPSDDVLQSLDQKQFGKREKNPFHNNILFQIWIEWKVSTQRCLAQGRSDVMICYSHLIGKIIVNVLIDSNFYMQ